MVLTVECAHEILQQDHSNIVDILGYYFHGILFIILVLTFESVNEILKCDHSNGPVYYAVHGGSYC